MCNSTFNNKAVRIEVLLYTFDGVALYHIRFWIKDIIVFGSSKSESK